MKFFYEQSKRALVFRNNFEWLACFLIAFASKGRNHNDNTLLKRLALVQCLASF